MWSLFLNNYTNYLLLNFFYSVLNTKVVHTLLIMLMTDKTSVIVSVWIVQFVMWSIDCILFEIQYFIGKWGQDCSNWFLSITIYSLPPQKKILKNDYLFLNAVRIFFKTFDPIGDRTCDLSHTHVNIHSLGCFTRYM